MTLDDAQHIGAARMYCMQGARMDANDDANNDINNVMNDDVNNDVVAAVQMYTSALRFKAYYVK